MTNEEIDEEFASIQDSFRSEPEQGKFMELFQGVNRKRTAIVVMINFFQQATGQAFASQYGTLYVKTLETINTFNLTVINGFISLTVVIICLYLNDKVGRR
jgi:SP family sugar:H+ symporter-like MFS transporter